MASLTSTYRIVAVAAGVASFTCVVGVGRCCWLFSCGVGGGSPCIVIVVWPTRLCFRTTMVPFSSICRRVVSVALSVRGWRRTVGMLAHRQISVRHCVSSSPSPLVWCQSVRSRACFGFALVQVCCVDCARCSCVGFFDVVRSSMDCCILSVICEYSVFSLFIFKIFLFSSVMVCGRSVFVSQCMRDLCSRVVFGYTFRPV